MEKTFEITPIMVDGNYVVANYDATIENIKGFINGLPLNLVITDDSDLKVVKEARTDIRKKKDQISETRKTINQIVLGTMNAQLKEIEGLLEEADNTMKANKDAYEKAEKNKVERQIIITLVVKGYDNDKITKVLNYAIKQGLQAEIK